MRSRIFGCEIIVGRPAAIDRRPLVLRRGSAILSASAVVIQWSGRWFLVGSWQCSGIWGRLVTATRTVVRRPVWGWFLRPNGAQNGSKMGPKWLPGGLLERLGILKAS